MDNSSTYFGLMWMSRKYIIDNYSMQWLSYVENPLWYAHRIVKQKENGSHANLCDNISFLRDEIMTWSLPIIDE
jgi:hypothetical protein